MRTITTKNKKEIMRELGFTEVEYRNLRKSTKQEQEEEKRRLVFAQSGPIWTDSTVIVKG